MSKVIEKIMCKRFIDFWTLKKIITPFQHGFFEGKSTNTVMFSFLDKAYQDSDKSNLTVAGLFADLSKAFDMVDHEILLYQLERCGIRCKADPLREDLPSRNSPTTSFGMWCTPGHCFRTSFIPYLY